MDCADHHHPRKHTVHLHDTQRNIPYSNIHAIMSDSTSSTISTIYLSNPTPPPTRNNAIARLQDNITQINARLQTPHHP